MTRARTRKAAVRPEASETGMLTTSAEPPRRATWWPQSPAANTESHRAGLLERRFCGVRSRRPGERERPAREIGAANRSRAPATATRGPARRPLSATRGPPRSARTHRAPHESRASLDREGRLFRRAFPGLASRRDADRAGKSRRANSASRFRERAKRRPPRDPICDRPADAREDARREARGGVGVSVPEKPSATRRGGRSDPPRGRRGAPASRPRRREQIAAASRSKNESPTSRVAESSTAWSGVVLVRSSGRVLPPPPSTAVGFSDGTTLRCTRPPRLRGSHGPSTGSTGRRRGADPRARQRRSRRRGASERRVAENNARGRLEGDLGG